MDARPLHDHPWDVPVSGAAPGAATEAEPAALAAAVIVSVPGRGEARSGFQVLSLEQYAASHARSMHQPPDGRDHGDR